MFIITPASISWPQGIVLTLLVLKLAINVGLRGKSPEWKYDGWSAVLMFLLWLWLLAEGGFFGGAQ